MNPSKKLVIKISIAFFLISILVVVFTFSKCFTIWGPSPDFCSSNTLSLLSLIPLGLSFMSVARLLFPGEGGIMIMLIIGMGIQLLYSYAIAHIIVHRRTIAEKYSKVLIFIVLIVFLYFAWILASNAPQHMRKLGLGEYSYLDSEGVKTTGSDNGELLKYSLAWTFITPSTIENEMRKDYQESTVKSLIGSKTKRLHSYLLESWFSILSIAILGTLFFIKRKSGVKSL